MMVRNARLDFLDRGADIDSAALERGSEYRLRPLLYRMSDRRKEEGRQPACCGTARRRKAW